MRCNRLLRATFTAAIMATPLAFQVALAQEQATKEVKQEVKQEEKKAPAEAERGRRVGGQRGPRVVSPEVQERRVTFRVLAPKAEEVRLSSSDIPGDQRQRALKKGENDVWELTLEDVPPGTYRYTLSVDGVATVDPRNSTVSESNGNVWSVVHVNGADFMDAGEVPHGAVARVHYRSSALGTDRRMHVYTPPGYETSDEKYPVFYLLHGAGDCDDSWTSVGRANFILDNLIASGKAKPMILVMPAGHTGPFSFGASPPSADGRPNLGANAFENDFEKDIRPYIEKHYRVLTDRSNRAIAGLSMGGAQTLNLLMRNLDDFGYAGVFSSGLFVRNSSDWEKEHEAALANAEAKKGLKLLWFNTGTEDFLIQRTRETIALFKKHGFESVSKESGGGHTWINWREYLNEFAPQLFH
jgi:enterochelin esterase-like enzyme